MLMSVIFNLIDYLKLVDWTGRQIREDKVGTIDTDVEGIFRRLSISLEQRVYLCANFESRFKGLVGCVHSLEQDCQLFGRERRPNLTVNTELYSYKYSCNRKHQLRHSAMVSCAQTLVKLYFSLLFRRQFTSSCHFIGTDQQIILRGNLSRHLASEILRCVPM